MAHWHSQTHLNREQWSCTSTKRCRTCEIICILFIYTCFDLFYPHLFLITACVRWSSTYRAPQPAPCDGAKGERLLHCNANTTRTSLKSFSAHWHLQRVTVKMKPSWIWIWPIWGFRKSIFLLFSFLFFCFFNSAWVEDQRPNSPQLV